MNIRIVKGLVTNIASSIGGVAILLGGMDDSPGLGGLGMILIGLSMFVNYSVIKDK